MPRLEVSDRKDSSSGWTSHSSRSNSTRDHEDDSESDRNRRQIDHDHSPDPDPPNCLRGETSRSNPLNFTAFLDKDHNLYVASHLQYLYDPSRYPHLIRYDSNRPLPNLLLRLGGTTPLLVLADLLQYPPPPISSTSTVCCPPSDWLRAQAWFLDDDDDDRNPSRRHPVFEHPFLTMEKSLGTTTIHEDFMVMFSRDIPPWLMRKMDNERPYCELGGHNQLNHYLLGWCWFWLQMEVSQRVDRIRAFLVEEEYEKLRGKEGIEDWERERGRIRREREEKEDDDDDDEENPFKKFGVNKEQAIREARDFVERMSGIGALWFPDSEKKGKFEKYFGDAIPSKQKLSGEGNTREYCVACNLSVVAGSGEEVLAALLANMISRAPCKNEKDVAEEDGGLPKLYPLVDAWIENLGEERAKVVKEKAKKLALTLFTIRKYLRWKGAPQGRDKWLYTDVGTDPYHPHDMNLTPSPTIRMMKEEKAVKREWECFCKGEDPLDEEEKKPSSSLSRTRIRESYSSKHTVPLSFYNLTNSQVSPAPAPSRLYRDYGTYGSHGYEITAAPIAVQGTVTVPGTSTALVRTRDYPSEEWDSNSNSDSEFDDATTLTCNSFTTIGTSTNQRLTNFSNGDDEDDNGITSVTTWSHLSAVPEALNLAGLNTSKREEREAQTQSERERYREERERYRHEGESLVSQAHDSHSSSSPAQHLRSVTDTRDWAAHGDDRNRDRDRDRQLVDRERYRHGGSPSSSTSSRRGYYSHRRERDKEDEEPARIALKLLSIKDHLHLARKRRRSGWERIKEE
ncbi:hypothetical protein GE21DRAFT_4534 [Neurospora crassa]|uniref:Uncharacterized protein n=1 Tax=Neurospora crassa (strain ATCC 24698 / 74-OR23-1A / CBS 708.71 / DSM 1257 / FGSC 987) TaxID=367110 RepID=Q7RZY0_NEUCR|nr:hypothetical protein NCU00231 [Neurospora crassa OR74A]EAA28466.2 hypothetical protein NCU00231 [Neurospora crassa OR74A]KHE89682.1 hypothetical protein GE21DRAFT_4534 [Neurospora crassa]|eukprot:XP_957702.2 hypothetical protein NCU00231 [Neurospora crassa OR74A]